MILKFQPGECEHPTVMKNMCAECGADLQQEMSMVPSTSSKPSNVPASISIVHSIPELKVSSNVITKLPIYNLKLYINLISNQLSFTRGKKL